MSIDLIIEIVIVIILFIIITLLVKLVISKKRLKGFHFMLWNLFMIILFLLLIG